MNSESNPRSSTVRANALMPRARSGPSPAQMYEGRKTPNRPTSLIYVPPPCGSASSAVVLGLSLGEERPGALQQVVAGKDPFRGLELGGQARIEDGLGREADQS